jgi:hypothetical protein
MSAFRCHFHFQFTAFQKCIIFVILTKIEPCSYANIAGMKTKLACTPKNAAPPGDRSRITGLRNVLSTAPAVLHILETYQQACSYRLWESPCLYSSCIHNVGVGDHGFSRLGGEKCCLICLD